MPNTTKQKRIKLFLTALLITAFLAVAFAYGYMDERSRVNIYSGVRTRTAITAEQTSEIYKELKSVGCRSVKSVAFETGYGATTPAGYIFLVTSLFNRKYKLYLAYDKAIVKVEKA